MKFGKDLLNTKRLSNEGKGSYFDSFYPYFISHFNVTYRAIFLIDKYYYSVELKNVISLFVYIYKIQDKIFNNMYFT